MRPRIFIGSSREGHKKAERVKAYLSDVADCQMWDEGFFELNKSSFESLAESSVLFHFAIMVATKDDAQLKRDKLELVARDNIVFEFGLYIGRLGRNRAFFLREEGLDLPSDFYGITLPDFNAEDDSAFNSLEKTCNKIKQAILQQSSLYQLSFVPSTAIAVGYFENFVAKVARELMEATKRVVKGKDYASFFLHIVIPDELPDNFNDQVIAYLHQLKLTRMEVETNTRPYNFYLNYSATDHSVFNVYDIPTTLSALKKSIELAVPSNYIGESERERILKKKEMDNFSKTLEYLISKNAITRRFVKILYVDVAG